MTDEITVRSARDWDEVARGATGAGRAFPHRSPEEEFFHERTVRAPTLPLENTLLALDDGDVVGQLQLYERRAWFAGAVVPVAAIGNVCTLPEHRDRGVGSRLIEAAASFADEQRYAFSILLTGAGLREFYGRAGWTEVDHARREADVPAPDTAPDAFREFDADEQLDRVVEIHRAEHEPIDGAAYRPTEYWRSWILDPAHEIVTEQTRILTYPDDGPIEGYLAYERDDDAVRCLEVGYDGDRERSFRRACWDVLAADADGEPIVWYPTVGDSVEEVASDVTTAPRTGTMVQVHDADLLSRLADDPVRTTEEFADRLSDGQFYWSPLDAF